MNILAKPDYGTDYGTPIYDFTHVDLFAGIGGFSLAFEAEGFRTVAYSEINPDKCLVYQHHFPGVPNLGDIKAISGNTVGRVDVLTGGVPCQPASALGQMRGTADERWLWPEALRMVGFFRPAFGVFENPPSLLILESGRAWNGIVSGLVSLGYDCWWDVFPAAAFGAGHLRERVLLVIADAARGRRQAHGTRQHGASDQNQDAPDATGFSQRSAANQTSAKSSGWFGPWSGVASVGDFTTSAHPDRARLQGHPEHGDDREGWPGTRRPVAPPDLRGRVRDFGQGFPWWHEANTGVPVLAHGLPSKLVEAAARCAGDAVVPQVIQPIARAIYQQLTNL